MKTLYISDMDGTLLNSDGKLSEYTRQKLNEFYEKGILFSLATARSNISLAPLIKGVHFAAPVVIMNGVALYDTESDKIVSYHEIDKSALNNIFSAFTAHGLHPFMFLYDNSGRLHIRYTEFDNAGMERFYNIRKDVLEGRFTKADVITDVPDDLHPIYVNHFAPYDQLFPVTEELKKISEISFAFYKDSYSDDWLIEIYSNNASKAHGAEEIKERLNADSITAFGDNLNDLVMLYSADRSVAVGNAVSEVKSAANIIIGTNNDDSVVKFVESEN